MLKNRVIFSLIIAIFFIGGAFLLKLNQGKYAPKPNNVAIIIENTTKKVLAEDSDGDGLKDWEESIRKSNPNIADTDKDGTNDGDEINEGRNPLIASPNDKDGAQQGQENEISKKKPTPTDLFSREVFEQYLEAKKNGEDISADLEARIAEAVLSQDYEGEITYFDKTRLKINQDTSAWTLRNYGNMLGNVLTRPRSANLPSEIFILEKIQIDGQTEADLANLKLISDYYLSIRNSLAAITVPIGAENAHTQIIQSFEILKDFITGIQMLEQDPIGSLSKIARYEEGIELMNAGTLGLQKYFLDKNIVFSPSENGYVLIN